MNKKKENTGENDIFLALTAIEDFWDSTKPIVFLGEWCCRYSRKVYWGQLDAKIVDNPWKTIDSIREAYRYVDQVFERLIPKLSNELNKIQGVNFSQRYWRILLGPWLKLYIPIIYDRYILIKTAMKDYPGITTLGLAEENFQVPKTTLEFSELIKGDLYNLQIFTKILQYLGVEFPKSSSKNNNPNLSLTRNRFSFEKFIKGISNEVLSLIESSRPIVMKNSYFSRSATNKLMLKTKGRVWPNYRNTLDMPIVPYDPTLRFKLNEQFKEDNVNEFEKLLFTFISEDMPISLLEGYKHLEDQSRKNYSRYPKVIFSANAWYYDEVFKHWAASSSEKGSLLIGVQHGGNYGSSEMLPSEEHELSITDLYYSWGWERKDSKAKVIPFFAPKLVGRKKQGASNAKEGVLFVSTSAPRYLVQFPNTTHQFVEYLEWQSKFVQNVNANIQEQLRVRLHSEDQGWDFPQRWKDQYPEVNIEKWNVSFLKSLENCRVYVCDHLSTTFIEALAIDKPTILFWNLDNNPIRNSAEVYYQELINAGILHSSPESAAKTLNLVYHDIEAWWNDPYRQSVINNFCNHFAKTKDDGLDEWKLEFKRIMKEEFNK